jgi:hypothetical protein
LLIGNQGMKHGDSDTALTDDTASLLRQLLLGNQGTRRGDTQEPICIFAPRTPNKNSLRTLTIQVLF